MLKLIGRADASELAGPVANDVWRVCLPEDAYRGRGDEDPAGSVACLLRDGQAPPPGYGLYLVAGNDPGMKSGTPRAGSRGPRASGMPGPVLGLGPELAHLDAGDIIYVSVDGRRIGVLWKNSARHNALLLTEQCDNCCSCARSRRRTATTPGNGPHAHEFRVGQLMQGPRRPSPAILPCATRQSRTAW